MFAKQSICRWPSQPSSEDKGSLSDGGFLDLKLRQIKAFPAATDSVLNVTALELWAHFTTSLSVWSVIDSGLIKSIAEQEAQGQAPFTGEITSANLPGELVRKSISFISAVRAGSVIDLYAIKPLNYPFNLKVCDENIKCLEHAVREHDNDAELSLPAVKERLRVYRYRRERFTQLTPEQQSFITDPFPVAYCMRFDRDAEHARKFYVDIIGISGEIGILHAIPLEQVTIAVPEYARGRIISYAKQVKANVNVKSFEEISDKCAAMALTLANRTITSDEALAFAPKDRPLHISAEKLARCLTKVIQMRASEFKHFADVLRRATLPIQIGTPKD